MVIEIPTLDRDGNRVGAVELKILLYEWDQEHRKWGKCLGEINNGAVIKVGYDKDYLFSFNTRCKNCSKDCHIELYGRPVIRNYLTQRPEKIGLITKSKEFKHIGVLFIPPLRKDVKVIKLELNGRQYLPEKCGYFIPNTNIMVYINKKPAIRKDKKAHITEPKQRKKSIPKKVAKQLCPITKVDIGDYGGNFIEYTPPAGKEGLIIIAIDTNPTNPCKRLYIYAGGQWNYINLV